MVLSMAIAPYHILLYSFTFGASTFQSFISAPIAFKVLSKDQFSKLQNSIFPKFFLGQTLSPLLIGLTAPYTLTPLALSLLAVSSIGGGVNFFYLLPLTQKVKLDRVKLGDVDTVEMKTLNKKFGKVHGMSLLFNMISVLSIAGYVFPLTKGLRL